MMEERKINEQESLLLIQQMISTAKKEQRDDGKGWIIWGWMLFAASILTIINMKMEWFDTFFFWNVFGVISFVLMAWETIRYFFFKRTERVKTYTSDLFSKLNVGFFICLMFIIVAINVGSREVYNRFGNFDGSFVRIGFALLINLYSFWILVYGSALNFKPSVIGAYISWAFGFAAMFVDTFEQVMILHAIAVLVGYIIPGHLANKEFRKLHREDKAGV